MTLALLHTTPLPIAVFAELCAKHLAGTGIFHMVDESLLKNTIASGRLEPGVIRRVVRHIESAREGGADAVLVTCSSIGQAATVAQQMFDFPVIRVDTAMAEEAAGMGGRIGVLATLRTTLAPTVELLRETALRAGREAMVEAHLCEGAFEAVSRGDGESHDRMVREGLLGLLGRCDVVVLAQASMARIVGQIEESARTKPILSSPELAVLAAKRALANQSR
ncbi:MAG: hypothetical protein JNK48_28165 [Bryobacterales bacterium]|nr:hypothetical protein [Bryobacterales bacterium]